MAHEIEMVNGNASMAYAGETPWHGLGVKVSNDLTAIEMMNAANVNWNVVELDSFVNYNGKQIATGQKALVRDSDGKVLTQVGKDWNPVQNKDAFEFFQEYVDAGKMQMHTAGSLKGGEIVWALAKVDDSFELFNGDKVESYLLFSNPHQYGKTINIRFTPIRVVCNNTLTLSIRESAKNSVKLNHRKEFNAESVKETLGIAQHKMEQYKEMAQFLGSKRTTQDTLQEYFGELLGVSKKNNKVLSRTGERAMELIHEQPGAKYAEGSFWSAFNAITYMVDHELGRSADTRLTSSWYGINGKLKTDALELALDMAKTA
jgi:phage/plasmid-like protein (TIGR03299 family)